MPKTPETIERQINALERMTTTELVERFAEVHGDVPFLGSVVGRTRVFVPVFIELP